MDQVSARYRSLIEDAAYGIYRSTADGTILDANPALARMLGYDSVEELMAQNMASLYASPGERAQLIERFDGLPHGAADVRWRRKDGTPILVRLTARMVDVKEGVAGFEGIAEDITARHALEQQLRQAQKMEAVGRLARGIAHDFNNVLAAIMGSCDLLLLRLKESDPAREDALEIRKAGERGAALTRQLLAFSRGQTVERQLLDLNDAVLELETMLQRLAGEQVGVTIRTQAQPVPVRTEPGQLEQVLLNLVINARDAMPAGGTIDIEVDVADLDPRLLVRYPGLSVGRYARLAVRDTGTGIDPDAHAHVFEPFYTTKEASRGTGLGLSIVYAIAKEHGGTITFSSTAGAGTTFELLLPLEEGS